MKNKKLLTDTSKLNYIIERIEKLDDKVDEVRVQTNDTSLKLTKVDTRIQSLETKVGAMHIDVEGVKGDTEEILKQIKYILENGVTQEELQNLEQRVTTLEHP